MSWKLTAETYWRREGEDVVLATPGSILRLNATSTRSFLHLLGLDPSAAGAGSEAAELIQLLSGEGMIAPAGPGSPEPGRQHLAHLRAPGNPD
jgi:hypothetical protein